MTDEDPPDKPDAEDEREAERDTPQEPTGPSGQPTPLGPCAAIAEADADQDTDVIAEAKLTDAPAEPIAVFLRAAADRLDEEQREPGEAPEEGATFDLSLEVRRRDSKDERSNGTGSISGP